MIFSGLCYNVRKRKHISRVREAESLSVILELVTVASLSAAANRIPLAYASVASGGMDDGALRGHSSKHDKRAPYRAHCQSYIFAYILLPEATLSVLNTFELSPQPDIIT